MEISKADLSSNARLVLKDLNSQYEEINRNPTSVRLRMRRYYGMSEVHVKAALEELMRVELVRRDVEWYSLTPVGRRVARSQTGPLSTTNALQ